MSSTARSSLILQKGAGKRVTEDNSDLSSIGKKMKGNRGRPWMDDSEGRVIHTAGKTQNVKKISVVFFATRTNRVCSGWAEWREVGGGAMIVATEHGLQGASRVGLTLLAEQWAPLLHRGRNDAGCSI